MIFFFRGSLFLNRPALMEFYRRKYDQKSGDNYVLEAPRTGKTAWSTGVVVCSPRLGWAVVSYLDFTPIPLTLEHIGTNLSQTAEISEK